MAGKLVKENTRDRESIAAVYENAGATELVAIRVNRYVYIDEALSEELTPRSRALMFVHETMHSYLDWETPMRNFKLKNMVRQISEIAKGNIRKRSKLHYIVTANDIELPMSHELIDVNRGFIEFFSMNDAEQEHYFNSITNYQSQFAPKSNEFWDSLSAADQRDLVLFKTLSPYVWLIQTQCQENNWPVFTRLVGFENVGQSEDTLISCLSGLGNDWSSMNTVIAIAEEHSCTETRLTKYLQDLSNKSVYIDKARIVASPELLRLFGIASSESPKTVLSMEIKPTTELPSELVGLIKLMSLAVLSSQEAWVNEKIIGSRAFDDAIGVKKLIHQLDYSKFYVPVEREREYARDHLIILHDQLTSQIVKEFAKTLGNEKAKTMGEQIKKRTN
ncbi:MAG: hypothetical protein KA715_11720 [Xanthomonadaceae bacterium]|nr:hypothetical protein [Xanthomonadaceae bacterium]